ncbi:Ies1p [Sugiyamaella lignohabitans]|uniref:Ies1p n=1 Tax=Sugiyamaella lignohabitans TaxID=796027 RepID=A0A161HGC3_9ASCO|nr:Ies1p [Sugiyamaella lignohabitans]ANB14760.1 Ies1p [Sugiyamaella lignohabitans]
MENSRRPSMIVHIPVSLAENGDRPAAGAATEDQPVQPKRSSFSVAGLLNDVDEDTKSPAVHHQGPVIPGSAAVNSTGHISYGVAGATGGDQNGGGLGSGPAGNGSVAAGIAGQVTDSGVAIGAADGSGTGIGGTVAGGGLVAGGGPDSGVGFGPGSGVIVGAGSPDPNLVGQSLDTFVQPEDIRAGSTPRGKGKRGSISRASGATGESDLSTPKSGGKVKRKGGKPGRKPSLTGAAGAGTGSTGGSQDGSTTAGSTPSSGAKRTYNRTYQTLLIATKVRHLKKGDGEPLWRVDIQYDFLSSVFNNTAEVFGNSYAGTGSNYTFADIYVDAMARSSKCSKVLREKLLGDKKAGLNMAMVCLLVNVGRMNTTLNFFPEMKAQLRTYHPIPSLQSRSNQSDYKQLQDAPRLKSILKGACEDRPEPGTLEDLMAPERAKPRTNPINLLFLLSTYASKVEETYFTDNFEFFDLIMNKELSSESRARAFLWLVYAYLETDGSREQLLANPFGVGQQDGQRIPALRRLSPEEVELENVDPISEKEFGAEMTKVRAQYLIQTNQVPDDGSGMAALAAGLGGTSDSANTSMTTPLGETPVRRGGSTGRGGRRLLDDSHNTPSGGSKKRKVGTPTKRTLRARSAYNYKEVGEDEEEPDASREMDYDNQHGQFPSHDQQQQQLQPLQSQAHGPTGHKTKVKLTVKLVKRSKQEEQRELLVSHRIKQMLQEKYQRRRAVRRRQGALRRTWTKLKDLDALYNSDDELASLQHQEPALIASAAATSASLYDNAVSAASSTTDGTSQPRRRRSRKSSLAAPIISPALDEFPGDYGEEQTAITRALTRSLRWLETTNDSQSSSLNGNPDGDTETEPEHDAKRPLPAPSRPDVMGVHNLLQEVAS